MGAGALGVGGATTQTAKDTGELKHQKIPHQQIRFLVQLLVQMFGSTAAGKDAGKDAGKSNLGGGQTDGMITAVAGRGSRFIASGKGNTGYYSGGGSPDGKKGTRNASTKIY